ncbi:MAG: hypothetical protein ACLTER_11150 [Ruminococcus sp.]
MLINISPFGNHFNLQFYRADFQIGDKAEDNPLLFPCAAEKKVDRLHFQYFDITSICGINDTICNLINRKIVLYALMLAFLLASAISLLAGRFFRRSMRMTPFCFPAFFALFHFAVFLALLLFDGCAGALHFVSPVSFSRSSCFKIRISSRACIRIPFRVEVSNSDVLFFSTGTELQASIGTVWLLLLLCFF